MSSAMKRTKCDFKGISSVQQSTKNLILLCICPMCGHDTPVTYQVFQIPASALRSTEEHGNEACHQALVSRKLEPIVVIDCLVQ